VAGCGIESALAAEQPLAADGRRWHSGRRPQLKRGVMPTDRKMMPIKEIEQAIRNVSDLILYKPINAELVSELVSVLMAIHFTARTESGTEAPLQ